MFDGAGIRTALNPHALESERRWSASLEEEAEKIHGIGDVHQAAAIIVEQRSVAFILETVLSAGQIYPVGLEEELEKYNGISNAQTSIPVSYTHLTLPTKA